MSEVAGSSGHAKKNELGPDYVGYYKHEIVQLFSQDEDFLAPSTSRASETSVRTYPEVKVVDAGNESCSNREAKSFNGSLPLFSNGLGEELSDFKKERLKAYLKQSVEALNYEVDDMLDCVIAINQVRAHPRAGMTFPLFSSGAEEDASKHICKKQKISDPVLNDISIDADSSCLQSPRQVGKDFRVIKNYELQSEEALSKSSNDLFAKLEHMEQHLEDYLYSIMSNCRAMTLGEKQQLCKRIRKLPAKALDRVVEIIRPMKSPGIYAFDEIHVDLEKEDNTALWRLHYFVEGVEIANDVR